VLMNLFEKLVRLFSIALPGVKEKTGVSTDYADYADYTDEEIRQLTWLIKLSSLKRGKRDHQLSCLNSESV